MRSVARYVIALVCLLHGPYSLAAPPPTPPEPTLVPLSLDAFQQFAQVMADIKTHYVHDISDAALFENAIRGMLSQLDPHSRFLDPEDVAELKMHTGGAFHGLGLEVVPESAGLRVITPLDSSPAYRVGIRPGDIITQLDNTPVKGLQFQTAIRKMRGANGSRVVLTVIRKPYLKPMRFTVYREPIRLASVKSELMAPPYGYIKIRQFQTGTPHDVETALHRLIQQHRKPLQGLILDLRNNPGGILDAAVGVTNLFLDPQKARYDKRIVWTKGRSPDTQFQAHATGYDHLQGAPLIVLINAGSASASEIVAGALQDHRRAIVIGQRSFGKGSVQTILPLGEEQAIKLTTALYYTPSGRSIQAQGIIPDIEVEEHVEEDLPGAAPIALHAARHEQDLAGHLPPPNPQLPHAHATTATPIIRPVLPEQVQSDLPLREAFHVMQALQLARLS